MLNCNVCVEAIDTVNGSTAAGSSPTGATGRADLLPTVGNFKNYSALKYGADEVVLRSVHILAMHLLVLLPCSFKHLIQGDRWFAKAITWITEARRYMMQ